MLVKYTEFIIYLHRFIIYVNVKFLSIAFSRVLYCGKEPFIWRKIKNSANYIVVCANSEVCDKSDEIIELKKILHDEINLKIESERSHVTV